MRVSVWVSAIAVVAVVAGAAIYDHSTYFFKPLTFRNTNVLYLPYQWYKKPMEIEVDYMPLSSARGVAYRTADPSQLRFVIDQLEKGQIVPQPTYPKTETSLIHVTLKTGSRETVLQDAVIEGPADHNVAQIYTETATAGIPEWITVTPALQKWITNAIAHGKKMP